MSNVTFYPPVEDFTKDSFFYQHDKPQNDERTKVRLQEIMDAGMVLVGSAEFGYPGIMSGLYLEYVWAYKDEDWNSYMGWAIGLKNKK